MKSEDVSLTPDERFKKKLNEAVATYHSEVASKHIREGLLAKAQQGYSLARPPIGYKVTEVRGLYKPDRYGMKLRELLQLVGDGKMPIAMGLLYLEMVLHNVDYRKPRKAKVIKVLTDPYYAGYVTWKGVHYHGLHQPLISLQQYRKIMWLLSEHENLPHVLDHLPEKSKG